MKRITWSIGRKLALGFGVTLILTLVVGAVGLFALDSIQNEVNTTTTVSARVEALSNLINISLLEARRNEKDFFLRYKQNGIPEAKAEYVTNVQNFVAAIHEYAREGRQLAVNEADRARFQEIEELIDAYEATYLQAVALVEERGHIDTGLEGLFRAKIHELETVVTEAGLDRLTIDVLLIRRHEKDYLLRGEQLYIDRVKAGVTQLKQDLASTPLDTAEQARLSSLADEYLALFLQLTQVEADLNTAINRYREEAHSIEPPAAEIRTEAGNNFQASVTDTNQTIRTANTLVFSALAVAGLLGFGVAILLGRNISRPVGQLTEAATAIANGDLFRWVQVSTRDEIGLLAAAFNQMTTNLRGLIGQVQQGAGQVANASGQLSTAATQSGLASQQVTNTIQQVAQGAAQQTQAITEATGNVEQMARAADGIARGAQEQAQEVQKTSLLVGEMAHIVDQVDQVTQAVSQATSKVNQAARHGVSTVQQTSQGMEVIRSRALTTAEKVKEMNSRSKEIGRIVETIDDIADKTDMLALNAAVEAARAGEHGRGFAVVADQVRKLSEDSKLATRDIGALIERVHESIREATAAMESTVTEVANGARLTGETAQSLTEILQVAEEAAVMAGRISGSVTQLRQKSEGVVGAMEVVSAVVEENTAVAEEMAAGSQQVIEAVAGVVSIAEENSASSEEVSASAEEMSAQVEEVVAASQELSLLAEQLRIAVAQFRLEEKQNDSSLLTSAKWSEELPYLPNGYRHLGTASNEWREKNGHPHKQGSGEGQKYR